MKKNALLTLGLVGMAFNAVNVTANSDDYPAANFAPKVVYIDKDIVQEASSRAQPVVSDPDHPAAYFQPKVLFLDESVAPVAVKQQEVIFDPNYPAAYFQPKVIYP